MNQTDRRDPAEMAGRLYAEALRLFEERDDADARGLLLRVVEMEGPWQAPARELLARVDARADEVLVALGRRLLDAGNERGARQEFLRAIALNGANRTEAEMHLIQLGRGGRPKLPLFSGPSWGDNIESTGPIGVERGPVTVSPIRRVPHLRPSVDRPLAPGEAFSLTVYADTTLPDAGEQATPLELNAPRAVVDVRLLTSPHLRTVEAASGEIRIDASGERSSELTFLVEVKTERDLAEAGVAATPAEVVAIFSHDGRPCGKVARTLATALSAAAADGTAAQGGCRAVAAALEVDPGAGSADLTVTVVATRDNDGRHFWCTVHTPLLPEYAGGVSGEWNLPDTTQAVVTNYMSTFTQKGIGADERIASLKGAGKQLFKAAPGVFQTVFWQLVDRGLPLRSIAIVSEEPYLPWELMVPRRLLDGGIVDARPPLGVEFAVGRWTGKDLRSAPRRVPLTDSYVIAPEYAKNRALPHAQAEAEYVRNTFTPGASIQPATFPGIVSTLQKGGRSLLHFACHGSVDAVGQQVIDLDNGQPLAAHVFGGSDDLEEIIRQKRPLVFLNACEVGRTMPALTGVGGFAESLIDMGAGAVIAPLWSVKDTVAHTIALEFYKRTLARPDDPFAKILSEIRAKAYDHGIGEDTYAAYCFYGDPLASRSAAG